MGPVQIIFYGTCYEISRRITCDLQLHVIYMVIICDLHVIQMGIAACDLYVRVACDLWVYGICCGSLRNVWETLCSGTFTQSGI